jgi:hypothetical protein
MQTRKVLESLLTMIQSKNPYIASHIVRIFGRKSRSHRTLGSHQIQVFCHWSEQLVGQEARRELKESLAHVLGAEASPEAAPTVDKHRPSHHTIAGLPCHSPSFKVSINMFPSSLWSRRCKPYQKLTTVARENSAGANRLNRCIGAGWLWHWLWRADGNPTSDRLWRAVANPALDRI